MHSGTLFWVCILFGIRSTISISYSSDADESIVLPKFGDRISPRTRTFIEVEKLRITNNNSNSNNNKFSADINSMSNPNYSADNHSNINVNSNNSNKTEHGFNLNALNASNWSGSAIDSHSGSNSVSVSYNENSTNGPTNRHSKHLQQAMPPPPPSLPITSTTSTTTTMTKKFANTLQYNNNHSNNNHNHNNNVYNNDNSADNGADSVEFDVIDSENDIYNALLRQHKSLNVGANDAYSEPSVENNLCNNKSEPCSNGGGVVMVGANADNELSNEIDLRNGNSTSAQAHRLEMSTEFFVVPSTSSSTIPSHHLPGGIYQIHKNPFKFNLQWKKIQELEKSVPFSELMNLNGDHLIEIKCLNSRENSSIHVTIWM